jgi:hypothetical protein
VRHRVRVRQPASACVPQAPPASAGRIWCTEDVQTGEYGEAAALGRDTGTWLMDTPPLPARAHRTGEWNSSGALGLPDAAPRGAVRARAAPDAGPRGSRARFEFYEDAELRCSKDQGDAVARRTNSQDDTGSSPRSLLILLWIISLSLKQGIDLHGIFNHSKFLKIY